MFIYGKEVKIHEICVSNAPNTSKYVWVAYDKSKARLPIAIAPTAEILSDILGVQLSTITGSWYNFVAGRTKNARYAKVYIGGDDDE